MKKSYPSLRRQILVLSLCSGPLMAGPCQAGPAIPGFTGNVADVLPQLPATTLPTGGTMVQGIDAINTLPASRMEIKQAAPKAVIHWQTFNIGSDSAVHFDQQGHAGWQALNAIADGNPSQIQGHLSADGAVYLINQNGILFGPKAQVAVNSLTAASLNLKEEAFLSGYSRVNGDNQQEITFANADGAPGGRVENRGAIRVGIGGAVQLIGGEVENSGTIDTPQGRTALAAGNEVTMTDTGNIGRKLVPEVTTTGDEAVAGNSGTITADEGLAGLYGGIVNQTGRVTAMTAVQRNGQIELLASKRVTTAAGSVTATPVTGSPKREGVAEFRGGEITVKGREVVHAGEVVSPGGVIAITATETINLEAGSVTDVSGTEVRETASERLLDVQLNSEVLKDAQVLKQGPLLGQTVTVDMLAGMPAADLSGYLENRDLSAAERLTGGGDILLNTSAATGSIAVAEGATIAFAGGGVRYAGGPLPVTRVRAGNRIYTLADLPAEVVVDEVLGSFEKKDDRFGVSAQWQGVYAGGGTPVLETDPSQFVGADAGSLLFMTPYLTLNGVLDGHGQQGRLQTADQELMDAQGRLNALGHKRPRAGILTVGVEGGSSFGSGAVSEDSITEAITIRGDSASSSSAISANAPPQGTRLTVIAAHTVNAARLSQVNLYANTTLSVEQGATLELMPGGSLRAMARQVTDAGTLITPGGSVTLASLSNVTSFATINHAVNGRYIPLTEKITIEPGSRIDVSGEIIDNTGLATSEVRYGITKGGSIDLANRSSFSPQADANFNPNHSGEITVSNGATLSARGGYWRGPTGTIKGGNAGAITIATSGVTDPFVTIDGTLEGEALLGNKGGALTIKAASIAVTPAGTEIPKLPAAPGQTLSDPRTMLVLADNRFAKTGFATIALQAAADLTVLANAHFMPSGQRLLPPESASPSAAGLTFTEATPFDAGATKILLGAGNRLSVEHGATVAVMPAGAIELAGNNTTTITVAGTLAAPAGTIQAVGKEIQVAESGQLLAAGAVITKPAANGAGIHHQQLALDAGTITLKANEGTISVDAGALLDLSGSAAITTIIAAELAGLSSREEAGLPGVLDVEFKESFLLEGTVSAASPMAGLPGGSVTITRNAADALLLPEAATLERLRAGGFDAFTLASPVGISLAHNTHLDAPRAITLNAPLLAGELGQVRISAPWVRLINTQKEIAATSANQDMGGTLAIDADFIDVAGDVKLTGFHDTSLRAGQELRLGDQFYLTDTRWSGQLTTNGDLLLQAAAVYPLTNSTFTLHAGGLLTILPQTRAKAHPIWSAAGKLTVEAETIDHQGVLAAPMGELTLTAGNRVQLAPGSTVSVRGQGEVALGSLQYGVWGVQNKAADNATDRVGVTQPAPTITISAKEIVAQAGSLVDADAGGTVTAHEFQPGLSGTVDPLTQHGRLIIVADNSVVLPDRGIYLEGDQGLGVAAGYYSVLPASFGFLANALVLEEYTPDTVSGLHAVNSLGQPVVAGYETVAGTEIRPAAMKGYTVRSAADVLSEGKFDVQRLAVNNGGTITLSGNSMVLAGEISAAAKALGQGGHLTAAGTAIAYGTLPTTIPATAAGVLPEALEGGLFIGDGAFAGSGLSSLTLGNSATESITLAQETIIDGIPQVTLRAKGTIHLAQGATILAHGQGQGQGVLELKADTLSTEEHSLLHATEEMVLDLGTGMELHGGWGTDNGRLRLVSDLIVLGGTEEGGTEEERPATGLFLSAATINSFAGIADLGIHSRSDIRFLDSLELDMAGTLTLDAGRLLMATGAAPARSVRIHAGEMTLQNTGQASTFASASMADHALWLDAGQLTLGPGAMGIDTFGQVTLASADDMVFSGAAALDAGLAAGGTLTLTAARFRAAFPTAADLPFTPSALTINGHEGGVFCNGVTTAAPASSPAQVPGTLAVTAGHITLTDAVIELPGGIIDLQATGEEGDLLLLGASELDTAGGLFPFLTAPGAGVAPPAFVLHGGNVLLAAEQGDIQLAEGATIDLSDQQGGEAGTLELATAQGAVLLDGTIRAVGGGSLAMDTLALADFSSINQKLAASGFDQGFALRVRSGDLVVGPEQLVTAREISLAADQGAITLQGVLRADGEERGGSIAIHARGDLLVAAGASIEARGTGPDAMGGDLVLSSITGGITTEAGSRLEVSGQSDGGTVTFRVQRAGTELPLSSFGELVGSRRTWAQAVKSYEESAITATAMGSWQAEADGFMASVAHIEEIGIIPEIEVRASGDMTLKGGLNTLASWRMGGVAGVLTFLSAGDLRVESDVIDAPTPLTGANRLIKADGQVDSTALNFVAGADLEAADPMACTDHGELSFGNSNAPITVFTESAPLRFASGGRTLVASPGTTTRNFMPGVQVYTLATFDGVIEGRSGGDLDLGGGGVVQSAMGAIRLLSGGMVKLGANGAIRTTGRAPEWSEVDQAAIGSEAFRLARYWDYRAGGGITISAQGEISGQVNTSGSGWDATTQETNLVTKEKSQHWGANYINKQSSGLTPTTGVAAMAGGPVALKAAGGIRGQAAIFGKGDLQVSAGGDLDGRFLAVDGDLTLASQGSFGTRDANMPLETGGGKLSLQAMGSVALGVIANPNLFNNHIEKMTDSLGYTVDSAALVVAVNGDALLSGKTPLSTLTGSPQLRGLVLPPALTVLAARDIGLQNHGWLMAPSPQGTLTLIAGRDIIGAHAAATAGMWSQGELIMSDADPGHFLGEQPTKISKAGYDAIVDMMRRGHQGPTPLHLGDDRAIIVHAGRDLSNLSLTVANRAEVRAERDILNLQYIGQNIGADDLSSVSAGHNLSLDQPAGFDGGYRGLQQGGPGFFLVEAGNDMDLGIGTPSDYFGVTSYGGIVTYGAAFNPGLQSEMSPLDRPKGADIAVIVGYDFQPGREELDSFVAALRQMAQRFSELQNSGDTTGAEAIKEEVRSELLETFLAGHRSGDGLLNMTSSTINTKSGADAITIITTGDVNVGVSTINTAPVNSSVIKDSGIFTTSGGTISLVADGDINVNESRVMSFLGGDIMLLSDHGDINAGRGSRTTVIAAPPRVVTTWNNNNTPDDPSDDYEIKKTVFDPPAAGSGLRALAYDPDASGPLLAPDPGNMYVVAWEGVVDAGEAGIEGGKLFLAATRVLNAQNITVGVGSVGMPAAAAAPAGLAALSGNSATTTAGTAAGIAKETTAGTASTAAEKIAETAKKIAEAMNQLRFFVVKFMGFMGSEAVAVEPPEKSPEKKNDQSRQ